MTKLARFEHGTTIATATSSARPQRFRTMGLSSSSKHSIASSSDDSSFAPSSIFLPGWSLVARRPHSSRSNRAVYLPMPECAPVTSATLSLVPKPIN